MVPFKKSFSCRQAAQRAAVALGGAVHHLQAVRCCLSGVILRSTDSMMCSVGRVWAVHQLQAQASTTRLDKQETTACTDTDPASAYLTGSGWAPPGA